MPRRAYPSDVTDEEWLFVSPYLTLMREDAPQREHDLREVFNGLCWVVRTGAQWRMMPNDLPPWHTVYQQSPALAQGRSESNRQLRHHCFCRSGLYRRTGRGGCQRSMHASHNVQNWSNQGFHDQGTGTIGIPMIPILPFFHWLTETGWTIWAFRPIFSFPPQEDITPVDSNQLKFPRT